MQCRKAKPINKTIYEGEGAGKGPTSSLLYRIYYGQKMMIFHLGTVQPQKN